MTKRNTSVVVCDECGKEAQCDQYDRPDDPWIHIQVSGGWVSDLGKAIDTDVDACSPICGVKVFEKATKRLQRAIERFPSLMGNAK